jgi:hypothetical protein
MCLPSLAVLVAEIRRILDKKVCETASQWKKLGTVVLARHLCCFRHLKIGRLQVYPIQNN